MRESRLTQAQIIGMIEERDADSRAAQETWADPRDRRQAEGRAWRDGPVRCQTPEPLEQEKPKRLVADNMLDTVVLKVLPGKS